MTDRTRAGLSLLRSAMGTVVWIAVCSVCAILGSTAAVSLPSRWTADAVIYLFMAVGGAGGLWGFWKTTWAYAFFRSGYRVRWVAGQAFLYEEFGPDGMLRRLSFERKPLADGYAPPCLISLPTAEQWSSAVPGWARDRRDEIVSRLTDWAQAGFGAQVDFVPPGTLADQA